MLRNDAIKYLQRLQEIEQAKANQDKLLIWTYTAASAAIVWQLIGLSSTIFSNIATIGLLSLRAIVVVLCAELLSLAFATRSSSAEPRFNTSSTSIRELLLTVGLRASVPAATVIVAGVDLALILLSFLYCVVVLVGIWIATDKIKETRGQLPSAFRLGNSPETKIQIASIWILGGFVFLFAGYLLIVQVKLIYLGLRNNSANITKPVLLFAALACLAMMLLSKLISKSKLSLFESLEKDLIFGSAQTDDVVRTLELQLMGSRLGIVLDKKLREFENRWFHLKQRMDAIALDSDSVLKISTEYQAEIKHRLNSSCVPLMKEIQQYTKDFRQFLEYCDKLARVANSRDSKTVMNSLVEHMKEQIAVVSDDVERFELNHCSRICKKDDKSCSDVKSNIANE